MPKELIGFLSRSDWTLALAKGGASTLRLYKESELHYYFVDRPAEDFCARVKLTELPWEEGEAKAEGGNH